MRIGIDPLLEGSTIEEFGVYLDALSDCKQYGLFVRFYGLLQKKDRKIVYAPIIHDRIAGFFEG